jgi:deoxyribodipyrimidine photo-lyase
MRVAVVLIHRDLRVHDHPALAAAVREADRVVPLFVLDDAILASDFARPNRFAFLLDALADLDRSLTALGGRLFVRRGDVVAEALAVAAEVGAEAIFVTHDVSGYAARRHERLRRAAADARVELRDFPGVTVVSPGDAVPVGSDHFKVFTPYWRAWRACPWRPVLAAPGRIDVPSGLAVGRRPALGTLVDGRPSPDLPEGGETTGRARVTAWGRSGLEPYGERHDDLAADGTSRLSPYLHFGCLSPLELAQQLQRRPGAEPFVRQLCWRDFYHQLLAARPETAHADMRPRGDHWRHDRRALIAWQEGRTGYPIVDAGLRQLAREGFMHNRARLITASFLTKHLYVDWRLGAAHFFDLLVDGDVANNVGNWQWVAGTGADTRPNRIFNPLRQAERHDPDGEYVRRYVPELAGVAGPAVHRPWELAEDLRRGLDYPDRIVDLQEAAAAFRAARA